nr:insulin-induced gene 2 protein [Quercus suber]
MSPADAHDDDGGPMLKSSSRRPFELPSEPPSAPETPLSESKEFPPLQIAASTGTDGGSTPARNRSIMNLTSSTLSGIYQPAGYGADTDGQATPWGTGAQTPIDSRHASFDFTRSNIPDMMTQKGPNGVTRRRKSTVNRARPRKGLKGYYLPILARDLALFSLGTLYGMLITRLHDRSAIVPVKVAAVDRSGWPYLAFWGLVAVVVGETLPWIDTFWAPLEVDDDGETPESNRRRHRSIVDSWNDVVRPIGAFIGVAFAIRKLPWQSTLQLSLTLALVNPAIWYLVDRSPPGFIFSMSVALSGTAVLLAVNPAMVPSPPSSRTSRHEDGLLGFANGTVHGSAGEDMVLGILSHESIGVAVWLASVLFVSAVCFGNVGRRLARRA